MLLKPKFENIPDELRSLSRWVTWKGRKIPYDPAAINAPASVTNPSTWGNFNQAKAAYREGGRSGVGFVLNGDGVVGVDLDKVVTDGRPHKSAMDLMDEMGCQYVEFSPSGTGLRGFGRGPNIKGLHGTYRGMRVEIYSTGRYLTVTGHVLRDGPLVHLQNFASITDAIRRSRATTKTSKKTTEVHSCHLLQSSYVEVIPRSALPETEGERNNCLFNLARYVKGKHPNATRHELRKIVEEWYRLTLPVIATKEFDISFADFMRGWENVKQPFGQTLTSIIEKIDYSMPLPAEIEFLNYGQKTKHLYIICCSLQAHEGANKPFFISCRQAGELLGLHYTDAAKLLTTLVNDGVLNRITKGSGRSASRYQMISPEEQ